MLLTVYQGKPEKNVIVLSTLHEKAEIAPEKASKSSNPLRQKNKPTTITYYNSTKCGVDSIDQMTRLYSVKYATRRWPVQVWSNILNIAGINSWILYKEANNSTISRRKFLMKLIDEIVELITSSSSKTQPQTTPSSTPSTPRLEVAKKRRYDQQTPDILTPPQIAKTAHCQIRLCLNNKSIGNCSKCEKAVCGRCLFTKHYFCKKCCKEENDE